MKISIGVYTVDKRMDFVEALQKACEGEMIARLEWYDRYTPIPPNSKFVFRQVPSKISLDTVSKMTSLPEQVKAEFVKIGKDLHYQNQFAMVTVFEDRNELQGWRPSEEDKEAKDWVVLERDKTV